MLWCSVSPLTSINPTTLFRTILTLLENQLSNLPTDQTVASGSKGKYRRPESSLDYFLWKFSTLIDTHPASRVVLVIKDAERIRDLWPEHVWTAFCRLSLLTGKPGRISVLFISTLAWSQYRTPSGLTVAHAPITIRFPRLTRPDTLSVLAQDFPLLWQSYGSSVQSAQMHAKTSPALCKRSTLLKLKKANSGEHVSMEALKGLYDQFVGVFYDSVRSNVRDVEELRTMSAAVWHSFIVPVQTRECTTQDLQTLLLASSHLFKDVIVRLQTREMGPREWTQESRIKSIQASAARLASSKLPSQPNMEADTEMEEVEMIDEERKLDEEEWLERETAALERIRSVSSQATISLLPSLALIPTFLVIASFLASYNPSRLDVRYFLRDDSLLSLSSGSAKGKSLKGGRKLGPGRGRNTAAGRRGRPSKSALRVTNEDGQTENLNRQQLLGPKPFPIDRLLSIFQALITEAAPEMSMIYSSLNPDNETFSGGNGEREKENDRSTLWEYRSKSLSVYSQINGLVARRMLVRTSAQDKLGTSINFRTNVSYSVVAVLAKRVKFELDEWLWDWGTGGVNGV